MYHIRSYKLKINKIIIVIHIHEVLKDSKYRFIEVKTMNYKFMHFLYLDKDKIIQENMDHKIHKKDGLIWEFANCKIYADISIE